jgi:cytochrome c-type biogenesis protein CcmF
LLIHSSQLRVCFTEPESRTSIMLAEIGLYALILALCLSLLQAIVSILGAHRGDLGLMQFSRFAAVLVFGAIALAFGLLVASFVNSDFSVALVVAHSQTQVPLVYKISGVWANHEGSMMLWMLVFTAFTACIACFDAGLPEALRARVLGVQGMIAFCFFVFILFTSNPFMRNWPAPNEGNGMNPILQDPGLAFHPPLLYLGYVGFSVTFSFAVAALIEGRVEAAWARWVRPWALAAWSFLTLGITLGSFWAYYTLGWGGWWFWDPVENVSLLPWLSGTALLHSAIVVERRQALVAWTVLLAILTFSFSLLGTFVVRSGVLTSVHAFALDPGRGIFMLGILVLATGGALTLYSLRATRVKSGHSFAFFSRESSLSLNNVFLVTAAATVFIGTFYPLAVEAFTSDKISVGAPYYNRTFLPVVAPLFVILAIGPFMQWKRDSFGALRKRIQIPFFAVVTGAVLFAVFDSIAHLLALLGLSFSFWIIAGSVWVLLSRIRAKRPDLQGRLRALTTIPRSVFGMILSHFGLGIVVGAITIVSTWQSENISQLAPGQSVEISGYQVTFRDVRTINVDNYESETAVFDVTDRGAPVTTLAAERRFFPVQQSQTSHSSIHTNFLSNLYISLGESNDGGTWTVRMFHHPGAPLLWIGGLFMALGGFVSLSDRRFRVAIAPRKAVTLPASGPVAIST